MLDRFPPGTLGEGESSVAAAASGDMTRTLVAEALGTGALAFLVVASGILAERYSGDTIGLAILITALCAAAGFAALACAFGPRAPGLFNPAFAFSLAIFRKLPLLSAAAAAAAQMGAACLGVILAHMVTNTGRVQVATQIQTGVPVWLGEFCGTALVIFVLLRVMEAAPRALALSGALALLAVALATPSLSLANPALTLARGLTDSFTSIRLADGGLILACQFAGALAASLLNGWLFAGPRQD